VVTVPERPLILVVEGVPPTLRWLVAMLEAEGYQLEVAAGESEATGGGCPIW
jgi:CheY-like chemotaxis protein